MTDQEGADLPAPAPTLPKLDGRHQSKAQNENFRREEAQYPGTYLPTLPRYVVKSLLLLACLLALGTKVLELPLVNGCLANHG